MVNRITQNRKIIYEIQTIIELRNRINLFQCETRTYNGPELFKT